MVAPLTYHSHTDKHREIRSHSTVVNGARALDVVGY